MAVHDELSLAQNVKYEDVTPTVPIFFIVLLRLARHEW